MSRWLKAIAVTLHPLHSIVCLMSTTVDLSNSLPTLNDLAVSVINCHRKKGLRKNNIRLGKYYYLGQEIAQLTDTVIDMW